MGSPLSISGLPLEVFPYHQDNEKWPSAAAGTRSQWLAHLKLQQRNTFLS